MKAICEVITKKVIFKASNELLLKDFISQSQ